MTKGNIRPNILFAFADDWGIWGLTKISRMDESI